MRERLFALILVFFLFPVPAFANMIWPGLFMGIRVASLPAILGGILIETIAIKYLFDFKWSRSFQAAWKINLVTALLAFFMIPILSIGWELLFMGIQFLYSYFKSGQQLGGTFSPIGWIGNFLTYVLFTALIELLILVKGFEAKLTKWKFLGWVSANCGTVGIAYASLFWWSTTQQYDAKFPLNFLLLPW